MIVITRTRLLDFAKQHPTSVEPLNRWHAIIKNADWSNFSDLKQLFPNADYVGNDRYFLI